MNIIKIEYRLQQLNKSFIKTTFMYNHFISYLTTFIFIISFFFKVNAQDRPPRIFGQIKNAEIEFLFEDTLIKLNYEFKTNSYPVFIRGGKDVLHFNLYNLAVPNSKYHSSSFSFICDINTLKSRDIWIHHVKRNKILDSEALEFTNFNIRNYFITNFNNNNPNNSINGSFEGIGVVFCNNKIDYPFVKGNFIVDFELFLDSVKYLKFSSNNNKFKYYYQKLNAHLEDKSKPNNFDLYIAKFDSLNIDSTILGYTYKNKQLAKDQQISLIIENNENFRDEYQKYISNDSLKYIIRGKMAINPKLRIIETLSNSEYNFNSIFRVINCNFYFRQYDSLFLRLVTFTNYKRHKSYNFNKEDTMYISNPIILYRRLWLDTSIVYYDTVNNSLKVKEKSDNILNNKFHGYLKSEINNSDHFLNLRILNIDSFTTFIYENAYFNIYVAFPKELLFNSDSILDSKKCEFSIFANNIHNCKADFKNITIHKKIINDDIAIWGLFQEKDTIECPLIDNNNFHLIFNNLEFVASIDKQYIIDQLKSKNIKISKTNEDISKETLIVSQQEKKSIDSLIRLYEPTKIKLKKQLETINKSIKYLQTDSVYSKIDFLKINEAKKYFEDIDNIIKKASQQEIQSTNYLMEDLSTAIKILNRKRKFKKDTLYNLKYKYLFINIKALHDFMINDIQGCKTGNVDETLLCYLGNEITKLNKESDNNFIDKKNSDCGNKKGYPVEISIISEKDLKDKPSQLFRINYDYYYGFQKSIIGRFQFGKLTSTTSCENVLPGFYNFWLTDESLKKIKICSHYQPLDISLEKFLDKNIPVPLDINVIK